MIDRFQDDVDARSADECAEARTARLLTESTANICFGFAVVFLLNAAKGKWHSVVGQLQAEGDSNRQIAESLFRLSLT